MRKLMILLTLSAISLTLLTIGLASYGKVPPVDYHELRVTTTVTWLGAILTCMVMQLAQLYHSCFPPPDPRKIQSFKPDLY